MTKFRGTLLIMLGLLASAVPGAQVPAQAPVIRKPRPVPQAIGQMPALPPAVIDNSLLIGGDDINARQVDTRLTVQVHVNGRGPYHFVVDSGADTSVVGLRIVRDLQLPLGTPVVLNSITERNIVDRVKVASLTLGPSVVSDLQLPALREQDLGADGMIGIDALVRQRLMMDFEKKTVKVEDARKPIQHFEDEIVIIAKLQHGQLILTEVKMGSMTLDAVIDTGSEISIGNMALRDKLIRKDPKNVWMVPTTGVTGRTINLQMSQIPELRLGTVILRNVPIAFADLPPFKAFGMADRPAMLLGTDLLSTFRRVSLDFHARKVRFQLKRCGTELLAINTMISSTMTRLKGGDDVCGT
jgi:hypothetical protein